MDFLLKKKTSLLFCFLLLLNYLAVYAGPNSYAFFMRGLDGVVFLLLYVYFKNETKAYLLLTLYSFFIIVEFLGLGQGEKMLYALYAARILRHILFIFYITSQIDFGKINKNAILVITGVALLNIYLVFNVMELIESNLFTEFQFNLLMMESALMLVLGFMAAIYAQSENTPKSKNIAAATFAFIFADVFFAIAFYGEVTSLFYLDITLFLVGFVFLTLGVLDSSNKLRKQKTQLNKPLNEVDKGASEYTV